MALIQCPDCSREVSDQAFTCPTCACPVKDVMYQREMEKRQQSQANKHRENGNPEPAILNDGAAIFLLIAVVVSGYLFSLSPILGISSFLMFMVTLYAESKKPKQKNGSSVHMPKKRMNSSEKQPISANSQKFSSYHNQHNGERNTYITNPRHGKEKMVWGMLLTIGGFLLIFFNPLIAFLMIIPGTIILFVGKVEHWWHWG